MRKVAKFLSDEWLNKTVINPSTGNSDYLKKKAFEFPSEKELQKYLKEHPKADKNLHSVKSQNLQPKQPKQNVKPQNSKEILLNRLHVIKMNVQPKQNVKPQNSKEILLNKLHVIKMNLQTNSKTDKNINSKQNKINKNIELFSKMNLDDLGFRPAINEKQFDGSEAWKKDHEANTKKGSTIIGTPHIGESVRTDKYIKKEILPKVLNKVQDSIKKGKKVVFLAEGTKRGFDGSEQRMIANELDKKFKNQIIHDSFDSGMDLYDENSIAFKAGLQYTNNDKDKLKVYHSIFEIGQGSEIDIKHFDNDRQKKLFKKITGVEIPKNNQEASDESLGVGKDLKGKTTIYADGKLKQKIYNMTFPEDTGLEETNVSKFAKFYNELRDKNLITKIKRIEDAGHIAIAVPGYSHAYSLKPIIENI